MSRFDVRRGASDTTYYLEVQSEFHRHLSTRVVIPLVEVSKVANPTRGLHVRVMVEDRPYYLITPMMAAVPTHTLGKTVASLEHQAYDITSAIDFLLQGF